MITFEIMRNFQKQLQIWKALVPGYTKNFLWTLLTWPKFNKNFKFVTGLLLEEIGPTETLHWYVYHGMSVQSYFYILIINKNSSRSLPLHLESTNTSTNDVTRSKLNEESEFDINYEHSKIAMMALKRYNLQQHIISSMPFPFIKQQVYSSSCGYFSVSI